MINSIIVADKEIGSLLTNFAGKTASLNLLGSFNDSVSARNQLSDNKDIGLVFIVPEALEMDCFDFMSSIDYQPNFIIVSSDDKFALKAFDFNVVDYLLKPVNYSRFIKAVDKANKYYAPRKLTNNGDKEIFIKKGSSLLKLKFRDIVYFEALENYVILHTSSGRFTIHFTLKGIENQIPEGLFCRIQRSFIVNKSMISTISENSLDVIIGDGIKNLPIGKSFKESLLKDINLITR
jgi:DNA-binding LytR/AlgR family response regulator